MQISAVTFFMVIPPQKGGEIDPNTSNHGSWGTLSTLSTLARLLPNTVTQDPYSGECTAWVDPSGIGSNVRTLASLCAVEV